MADRLWAPWRMEYVTAPRDGPLSDLFLRLPEADDATSLIVHRGSEAFVVLNRFPYNSGHVMIVPFRKVGALEDLTESEMAELGRLLQRAARVVKATYRPDGLNVGLNLGSAAGAGVAEHLHWHVVPRWHADANFMTAVGETRVLPEALDATWRRLREAWRADLTGL